jgi:hypothetical protein
LYSRLAGEELEGFGKWLRRFMDLITEAAASAGGHPVRELLDTRDMS